MTTTNRRRASDRKRQLSSGRPPASARIRPIVIYPFVQPLKLEGMEQLFGIFKNWSSEPEFCRPLVVVNNQTRYRSTKPTVEDPRVDSAYQRAVDKIIR